MAGWIIRRALLDDTPHWHRLAADAGDGGSTSVLGNETLALAMALDWIRANGFRRLSPLESQNRGRRFRVPPYASPAFPYVWRMALDRDAGGLSKSTPATNRREHGWHSGITLRVPGAFLRWRQLDQIAADLRRLDNRNLVTRDFSYFFGERTALCADDVPDFHLVRSRRAEPVLERNHDDGVPSFSRPIRRSFRLRLVGFLIRSDILFQIPAEKNEVFHSRLEAGAIRIPHFLPSVFPITNSEEPKTAGARPAQLVSRDFSRFCCLIPNSQFPSLLLPALKAP